MSRWESNKKGRLFSRPTALLVDDRPLRIEMPAPPPLVMSAPDAQVDPVVEPEPELVAPPDPEPDEPLRGPVRLFIGQPKAVAPAGVRAGMGASRHGVSDADENDPPPPAGEFGIGLARSARTMGGHEPARVAPPSTGRQWDHMAAEPVPTGGGLHRAITRAHDVAGRWDAMAAPPARPVTPTPPPEPPPEPPPPPVVAPPAERPLLRKPLGRATGRVTTNAADAPDPIVARPPPPEPPSPSPAMRLQTAVSEPSSPDNPRSGRLRGTPEPAPTRDGDRFIPRSQARGKPPPRRADSSPLVWLALAALLFSVAGWAVWTKLQRRNITPPAGDVAPVNESPEAVMAAPAAPPVAPAPPTEVALVSPPVEVSAEPPAPLPEAPPAERPVAAPAAVPPEVAAPTRALKPPAEAASAATGRLLIVTDRPARVFLNGKRAGSIQDRLTLDLPAGTHEVRLVPTGGGRARTQRATVSESSARQLSFTLN